ncbi:hypothetical protein LCGC14_2484850, partial [marine sediment metagenome]
VVCGGRSGANAGARDPDDPANARRLRRRRHNAHGAKGRRCDGSSDVHSRLRIGADKSNEGNVMALTVVTRGFSIGSIKLVVLRGFTAYKWLRETVATSTWTEETEL